MPQTQVRTNDRVRAALQAEARELIGHLDAVETMTPGERRDATDAQREVADCVRRMAGLLDVHDPLPPRASFERHGL